MTVASKQEAIAALESHAARWRELGVERLALFGSFVRDEANDESDVDLLVGFAPGKKNFDVLMDLCDSLEAVLGRHVDVVTLEGLSPFVGPHILAEAEDVSIAA